MLEKDIVEEPERVDETEMSVSQIGINADPARLLTHHVGRDEFYTTFMKTGNFVTAFGAKAGYADRLKAYREETGITLPVRYVIVPDHHEEQTAGAAEAVAAGAILLTSKDGATVLSEMIEGDGKIETVETERNISGLRIFPMSTDHARSVLAAYFEPQKAALQSSHYASHYADAPFYAKYVGVSLYNAYPQDVKDDALILISAESKKPETWQDFKNAVANHKPIRCHRNRDICEYS